MGIGTQAYCILAYAFTKVMVHTFWSLFLFMQASETFGGRVADAKAKRTKVCSLINLFIG